MSKKIRRAEMPPIVTVDGTEFQTQALYSANAIRKRVDKMGRALAGDYARGRAVHVVQVLSGGGRFGWDLLDAMQRYEPGLDITSSSVTVGSQTGRSAGAIRIEGRPDAAKIRGKHVLLVDGIMDSGLTINSVAAMIDFYEPDSLEVAVAMQRDVPRHLSELLGRTTIRVGFDDAPDVPLAGYGLDVGDHFRNFAGVYALNQVLAA